MRKYGTYIHILITLYLPIIFIIHPTPDIVVFLLFWYPFIFNIDLSIIIIFQTRPSTILPWSMANSVSNIYPNVTFISFYSVIHDNCNFTSNFHSFIFFRQGQAPFYHGGAPFLHHPVVPILPPPAPRVVIVHEQAPPEPEPVSYAELRAFWD